MLYNGFVALSAVFVVVDPVAAVPFFLAMTSEVDPVRRRGVARRAAFVTWLVLTGFAVAGAALFRALGISLPAFKIAGGVLLLIMAVDMLQTRASEARITEGEVQAGARKEDIAIVPLAMPLLAGPGSIATVVVLMTRARSGPWWGTLPVLFAVLVTSVAAYLVLAGASQVDRVLGHTGMNILQRVAGLLLAAIAIQFMLDGLGDVLPQLIRRA
ncbi:MarC family protein [Anaeromyxobacter paludicola]|uniref:MarC family protein n=1 Tax=Anaeromyxobacter paludicola TaxID=2918171 RepID=UPI00298CB1A0|nr:MarC family protein [Anaeromyxobacter paludicola]